MLKTTILNKGTKDKKDFENAPGGDPHCVNKPKGRTTQIRPKKTKAAKPQKHLKRVPKPQKHHPPPTIPEIKTTKPTPTNPPAQNPQPRGPFFCCPLFSKGDSLLSCLSLSAKTQSTHSSLSPRVRGRGVSAAVTLSLLITHSPLNHPNLVCFETLPFYDF